MSKEFGRKAAAVAPGNEERGEHASMSFFEASLRQTTDSKLLKDSRRSQREKATAQQRAKLPMLTEATKPGLHTLDELRNIHRAGPTLPPKDSREFQSISRSPHIEEPRYTPLSADLPPLGWLEDHLSRLEHDAERLRMPLKKVAAQSIFKSLYNIKACINTARAKVGGGGDSRVAESTAGNDDVRRGGAASRETQDSTFRPKSHFASRDQHFRQDGKFSRANSSRQVPRGSRDAELNRSDNMPNSGSQVDDLNKLSSQLLRAEMLGNADQIKELKSRIAKLASGAASKADAPPVHAGTNSNEKPANDDAASNATHMLMKTTDKGHLRPVTSTSSLRGNASIRDMVRYEKEHTTSDAVADFITSKRPVPTSGDGEYDDVADDARGGTTSTDLAVSSNKRSKKLDSATLDKMDRRERERAILDHKQREQAFEKCTFCLDNNLTPKHLIVDIGHYCYLHLPQGQNLVDHQCQVSPIAHIPSSVLLDENVFEEMQKFKRTLTQMYRAELKCDAVFVETYKHRKQYKHCVVECFPVDAQQYGEAMPFAFHNALMSSEEEWAQNVKLVDIKKRGGLQRAVPKELPFFAVQFNSDGSGYAHVIENETNFPDYFGKEVIAGVLDIEPYLYRRVHTETFEKQCAKVAAFEKMWTKFKNLT